MTSWLIDRFLRRTDVQSGEGRARAGNLAGIVGIVCNVLLFLGKFTAGTLSGSMAISADAFNNLSDAGSSVMSLLGFVLGAKKADPEHPFGHARYEYLAGMAVCVMIMAIGLNLAKEGLLKILHPTMLEFGWLPVTVMLTSILVKLWMSGFNRRMGELIGSDTLKATAADSRNDCLSTGAVLVSTILCEITGFMIIDGIMALAVALFILYSGYGLLKDALDPLLGRSPDPELVRLIEKTVMSYPKVQGMHDLLIHDYGPGNQFASFHVELGEDLSALEAHDLIDHIERDFWKQQHLQVVIHHDPIEASDSETGKLKAYILEVLEQYDPRLTIHDLRLYPEENHIDVLFDLLLPAGYEKDPDEALNYLVEKLKEKNRAYICAIKIDQSYI
ncbi:MAG: cation diffusion facilitator family transporter [Eubacteriales bacterium]|nr:cation diffusion facilitator family transporter [Eubacteriales bacterium]